VNGGEKKNKGRVIRGGRGRVIWGLKGTREEGGEWSGKKIKWKNFLPYKQGENHVLANRQTKRGGKSGGSYQPKGKRKKRGNVE